MSLDSNVKPTVGRSRCLKIIFQKSNPSKLNIAKINNKYQINQLDSLSLKNVKRKLDEENRKGKTRKTSEKRIH